MEKRRRGLAVDGADGDNEDDDDDDDDDKIDAFGQRKHVPGKGNGEFLRVVIEAGILAGVFILTLRSSAILEEKSFWRQKGKFSGIDSRGFSGLVLVIMIL